MLRTAHRADAVRSSLLEVDSVHEPLVELLDGGADDAAPTRLLQLGRPGRNTAWVCASAPSDGAGALAPGNNGGDGDEGGAAASGGAGSPPNLWLQYTMVRGGRSTVQALPSVEVLDFRASVVEVQSAVDSFVAELALMATLSELLNQTHAAGHFELAQYECRVSFGTPLHAIVAKVRAARARLAAWEAAVGDARRGCYWLAAAPVRAFWPLLRALLARGRALAAAANGGDDVASDFGVAAATAAVEAELRPWALIANTELGADVAVVRDAAVRLADAWEAAAVD
ncbi:hypothetical protein T492DRAFT_886544, partial [Pavlovales sp. CCMP2436]